jgi:hypothetical protein
MSQNAYSQSADLIPPPESRSSVLAILSLVCSLICLIPGLGLLGAIMGIAALFSISRSQGAVRGNGMAVTGIIIGLVVTVIWLGILIAGAQFNAVFGRQFVAPVATLVQAMDRGDHATARKSFEPALDAAVTDEQIAAFTAAYQAELGSYKNSPQSLWEMIMAYAQVGPAMQNFQGGGNQIPVPIEFDKGMSVVIIEVDPSKGQPPPGGTWVPRAANLGVLTPAGKEIWLIPAPGAPPSPSTPDAPDATEAPEGEGEPPADGGG